MDTYENVRRGLTVEINAEQAERDALEVKYGQVWDTAQLTCDFNVHGFLAPFVSVTRKSDGVRGSLTFQHFPRFYFAWTPDGS